MKKLLVTAIGAAAAFGAVAGTISTQRFETAEISADSISISALNTLAGATTPAGYWSGDEETNTYKVVAVSPAPTSYPFEAAPTKGLEVKTVFGNPLTLNAVDGGTATTIPASGLYFDSEVKFTVCEDEPDQTYSGAKIVMWLQEKLDGETVIGTNLIVRAGYLSKPDSTIISTPTNYVCDLPGDFDVDAWHRVTIKAMANITTGGVPVPGFAIYIDPSNSATEPIWGVGCLTAPKWDATFSSAVQLTEAASLLETNFGCVFPTMDLTSGAITTLTSAGFDGTGWITDICFTDEAPAYAEDMEESKASVKIGEGVARDYGKLADAIAAVNAVGSGNVRLTLAKGMELAEPIEFTTAANVVLDFGGFVLTNTAAACAITNFYAAITVVDSGNGGGIRCTTEGNDVGAFYNDGNGSITIAGGNYWAKSVLGDDMNISVTGGKFDRITWGETDMRNWIGSNKKFVGPVDGLYSLANREYYTVTFNANNGEGSMAAMTVEDGVATNLTANAFSRTGYTFAGWNTAAAGTGTAYADEASITPAANLELYAQWNAESYNVTFVDSEAVEPVVITKSYGSTISAGEIPAVTGKVGYTAAWDNDPTNATVTAAATYTVIYTGKEFTIKTYTNGVENTSKVFTYAGASVVPADPLYNTETETWDGKWYTTDGGSTEFAFDAAGELTQNAYATIEAKGGSVPVIPAGGETDCGTADAATAAAAAINADAASKAAHIAKPSTVGDGAAATTYYSYVEAKAVGTKVTVDFTTDGVAAAQTSANTDVVALPVAAAAADDTEATVSTVAGFYYSIVSGTTPTTVTTEGTRVLGNGSTIKLDVPNKGSAGFYKVKVSARAAD